MCERCIELDRKIAHYRAILSRIRDQAVVDGVSKLIAELMAEKATIHSAGKE